MTTAAAATLDLPALLTAARQARDAGVPLERPAMPEVVASDGGERRERAAFQPIAAALDELEQLLPDYLGLGKPFRWSTSLGDESPERQRGRERATSGHFRVGDGWSEIRAFERSPDVMLYGVGPLALESLEAQDTAPGAGALSAGRGARRVRVDGKLRGVTRREGNHCDQRTVCKRTERPGASAPGFIGRLLSSVH